MFLLIRFPCVRLSRDGRGGLQRGGMICCLLDLGTGAGSSNCSLSCDNGSRGDGGSGDHSHGNSSPGPRSYKGFPVLQP